MNNLTQEEVQANLKEYFASYQHRFSIGLQNFQSIREYSEIPLSPITLIYGPNSAGKSTIHDALHFISHFMTGADGVRDYLDRWASNQRISRPITKGFQGNHDDVVITIAGGSMGCSPFDTEVVSHGAGLLLNEIFDGLEGVVSTGLKYHFGTYQNPWGYPEWYIRSFSLMMGQDEILSYECAWLEDEEVRDTGFMISKNHPLIKAIGIICGQSFDGLAEASDLFNGTIEYNADHITLCDLSFGLGASRLVWGLDNAPWEYKEINEFREEAQKALFFRGLISNLIEGAAFAAGRKGIFSSVPPLRPIPNRTESVIYLKGINGAKSPWESLAENIKEQDFFDFWETIHPEHVFDRDAVTSGTMLPYVNHILNHPSFLGFWLPGYREYRVFCVTKSNESNKE
jgi:hypothetical protein